MLLPLISASSPAIWLLTASHHTGLHRRTSRGLLPIGRNVAWQLRTRLFAVGFPELFLRWGRIAPYKVCSLPLVDCFVFKLFPVLGRLESPSGTVGFEVEAIVGSVMFAFFFSWRPLLIWWRWLGWGAFLSRWRFGNLQGILRVFIMSLLNYRWVCRCRVRLRSLLYS